MSRAACPRPSFALFPLFHSFTLSLSFPPSKQIQSDSWKRYRKDGIIRTPTSPQKTHTPFRKGQTEFRVHPLFTTRTKWLIRVWSPTQGVSLQTLHGTTTRGDVDVVSIKLRVICKTAHEYETQHHSFPSQINPVADSMESAVQHYRNVADRLQG